MMRVKCRPIELALALCMAFLFAYAAWVSLSQQTLADGLLRLHVIANSDSVQDQQVKLLVRDRVLAVTEPLLADADNQDEVRRILSSHLQQITDAAQQVLTDQGMPYQLSAQMATEYYPTREYATFSLPAGQYTGIKMRLGAASGHNWRCVVFPPLCTDAAQAPQDKLCEQKTFRFKTADLIGQARAWLRGL